MSHLYENILLEKFHRQELVKQFNHSKWPSYGRVLDIVGTIIEAMIENVRVGTLVKIHPQNSEQGIVGEVVGFKKEHALILPFSTLQGVSTSDRVEAIQTFDDIIVGDFLLGRVVDPFLNPMDGHPLEISKNILHHPIECLAPNPLERQRIKNIFSLGVRTIDSLLTLGEGQRVGILAGSGVGKSVLMGMIARGSESHVNVIGLIGERGREVREFIEKDLGEEGLKRSVLVVVTGDQSPLMRIRAAKVVTAIAEHFSRTGKKVLLMMDSLTRVAMAQREIGLAIGEAPTTKGYTPSVFSLLPQLLERTGPQKEGNGFISALYTVLVDGDDMNDPIADAARAILDGHVVLSRSLANRGFFPAIDVSQSTSRVMHDVISDEQWKWAQVIKSWLSVYQENLDLIQIGAYQSGSNPTLDEAIRMMPVIQRFLKQDIRELTPYTETIKALELIATGNVRSHA